MVLVLNEKIIVSYCAALPVAYELQQSLKPTSKQTEITATVSEFRLTTWMAAFEKVKRRMIPSRLGL
jgi:hypothetical protein